MLLKKVPPPPPTDIHKLNPPKLIFTNLTPPTDIHKLQDSFLSKQNFLDPLIIEVKMWILDFGTSHIFYACLLFYVLYHPFNNVFNIHQTGSVSVLSVMSVTKFTLVVSSYKRVFL